MPFQLKQLKSWSVKGREAHYFDDQIPGPILQGGTTNTAVKLLFDTFQSHGIVE